MLVTARVIGTGFGFGRWGRLRTGSLPRVMAGTVGRLDGHLRVRSFGGDGPWR